MLRVPEDLGEKYKAFAKEAGFKYINDYLAYKLAEAHGLIQDSADAHDAQQRLFETKREAASGARARRTSAA